MSCTIYREWIQVMALQKMSPSPASVVLKCASLFSYSFHHSVCSKITFQSCFRFVTESMARANILRHLVSFVPIALLLIGPSTARSQLIPSNGTAKSPPPTNNITSAAKSGFVRTAGARFELDGKPFTFGGSNLWSSQSPPNDLKPSALTLAFSGLH